MASERGTGKRKYELVSTTTSHPALNIFQGSLSKARMTRMFANAILVPIIGLTTAVANPDDEVVVSSNNLVPPRIHSLPDLKLSSPSGLGPSNHLTLAPRILPDTNSTPAPSTPAPFSKQSAPHYSLQILKPDACRHYCLDIVKPDAGTNYVIQTIR